MMRAPPGVRQTREGYWLGPMLREEDLPFLQQKGITLILSAVRTPEAVTQGLADAGISQTEVLMGTTFRHAERILESTAKVDPGQCFIHCQHGADRTGCILAFLLCTQHGWTIADAFYSVLYLSWTDANSLGHLLESVGIKDRRFAGNPTVGFYSHEACGLRGGLKARTKGYQDLILSTIREIRRDQAL